jgi:hypothetical protein
MEPTKGSLMTDGDYETQDFPSSAFCSISLQFPLIYVCQPKMFVASKGYHAVNPMGQNGYTGGWEYREVSNSFKQTWKGVNAWTFFLRHQYHIIWPTLNRRYSTYITDLKLL